MTKEKEKPVNSKFRVAFFGTPDYAVPTLQVLLTMPEINLVTAVTQPDRPAGRGHVLTSPPVKKLAEQHNLPVCQPDRIKSVKFEKCLRDLELDVIIVVAYGKIIPEKFLDIPKYGWLNIHGSLLPKYRGASPIQSAILNGEKETGVTLMKIDAGLDTGAIICEKSTELSINDNFETLHDRLAKFGAELIRESLISYLEGGLPAVPQNDSLATKTSIISKDDGRIDWAKDADSIERMVRAFNPWPGSFCKYGAKTLKIHSLKKSDVTISLDPGETKLLNGSLLVGCGKGILEINNVQLEGKKPQSADEFINGNPNFKETKLS